MAQSVERPPKGPTGSVQLYSWKWLRIPAAHKLVGKIQAAPSDEKLGLKSADWEKCCPKQNLYTFISSNPNNDHKAAVVLYHLFTKWGTLKWNSNTSRKYLKQNSCLAVLHQKYILDWFDCTAVTFFLKKNFEIFFWWIDWRLSRDSFGLKIILSSTAELS